jgi:hypothetical protein
VSRLNHLHDLAHARAALLRLAAGSDRAVLTTMLAEALVQLERVGPAVSGDVWEAYAAVERSAERPHAE